MSSAKTPETWTYRLLKLLISWAYFHPRKVIVVGILSFIGCLVYTAQNLEFATDRAALVDQNERFRVLSDQFQKEFPNSEDLIVVIDGGTPSQRERFSDDLAARLRPQTRLFSDIFHKVELPFLRHQALQYLEVDDLQKLRDALQKAQGMVSALSTRKGVGDLLAQTTQDMEVSLPVLNGILEQLIQSLQTRGRYHYESPWQRAFFEPDGKAREESDLLRQAGQMAFYNTMGDGRIHLLLARPTEEVSQAIQTLRQEIKRLKPAYPDLEVGLTGELVLDEDEMQSSIADSSRATLWSVILVILMFAVSFYSPWRPAMALFALLLSVGWTIGFTTLAVGHLNLLTVTFATMLIGMGADFGIHFIYGYEEERSHGTAPLQAMLNNMHHAGVENLTGAITTAIAFWAICFTDFRGVAELGLIAGTGVILSFLAMATTLPAMIFLQEAKELQEGPQPGPAWAGWVAILENSLLAYPKTMLLIYLGFTLWCLVQAQKVSFDYNLLHLQSPALQSVQTEQKLLADERGVLFAVALADNLPEAEKKSQQFSALPSVARVESILPLVPKSFPEKAPLLEEIASLMQDVPLPRPEDAAKSGTSNGLMQMADGFMLLESTFRREYPRLLQSPDPEVRQNAIEFKHMLDRLFSTLEKMGPGPISDGVTYFQFNLYQDLRVLLEFLKDQWAHRPITLEDLPSAIKLRSLGKSGKILLRIYPKGNPWERQSLEVFVRDIQSVDPSVIGTPVMVYYHTESLKRAFELSGKYALGAIALVLLVHFRNLKNTVLALMPKLVGVVWMLGLMGYYKVQFNPANFMALPLILGIGLIFGVHVVHRLLHNPREAIFSHSTGPAIALSAATTMAGFGTLMMAHHQGIASLGFLMTAGVGANLVTSLLLLPAFMRVFWPQNPPETSTS